MLWNRWQLFVVILLGLVSMFVAAPARAAEAIGKPNIILIFTDDQGYGDVGYNGAKGFKTPHIDQMGKEGMTFTDFYVGCAVCSGSRTALLTGTHYRRLHMAPVLFPNSKQGLNPKEETIAEVLKPVGYATACIGKWHLGHLPPCLPTMQGFDYYYGIPYSNDMWLDPASRRAKDIVLREGVTPDNINKQLRNRVPLMRNDEVIEYPTDQRLLTRRYTEETIAFIKKNKDRPFFIYLPHTMCHVPLAVSKEFTGRTKSKFGDVIEELDWSVGEILKTLKEQGIDDNTLVIFTTDNGAATGSSKPLRAKKASIYEGGIRVPCIMRWPGKIPAGKTCREVAATIDILPTLAYITGAKLPAKKIDGKNIWPLMIGKEGARSPHEYYVLAHNSGCVRSGKWKYYPKGGKMKVAELYDLSADLSETKNVAAEHADVVARMQKAYEDHMADLKQNSRPAATMKR